MVMPRQATTVVRGGTDFFEIAVRESRPPLEGRLFFRGNRTVHMGRTGARGLCLGRCLIFVKSAPRKQVVPSREMGACYGFAGRNERIGAVMRDFLTRESFFGATIAELLLLIVSMLLFLLTS